jgi:adenine-specific DNA-methyltransferase
MFWASLSQEAIKMYGQKDEKGVYRDKDFAWKNSSAGVNQKYPIKAPDGETILPKPGYIYRFIESRYLEELRTGNVTFKKSNTGPFIKEDGSQASWNIYIKKYLNDAKGAPVTVLPRSLVGINNEGTTEVQELLGGRYFESPKNVRLMKYILEIGTNKNCTVLDFFSGSGSTAHGVMQLNAEDGGNRKWVMVQLPEETDGKSEAYKAGYKSIPEISRERIRRAGDKIATEFPDAKVDYGFRALTIADTNYKDVYKSAQSTTQQELLETIDNIKEDRSDVDLLYGVLTATALELNRPIEKREISGSDVYLYDYFGEVSGLIACFSSSVPEDTIKEIAGLKPLTAVFKDSSFPDSQAKVNLSEHFRIISPDTKVKVI